MQATNAKLIWATTSVVPKGAAGRVKGDEIEYNKIALGVMDSYKDIYIDDQYKLTLKYPKEQKIKNVHFNEAGKARQAKQVSMSILAVLK